MTALYLTAVLGTGTYPDPYRADVTGSHACLMLHEAKARAVVLTASDTQPGTRLLSDASVEALRARAATTSPTPAQRAAVNGWLTANGYQPLPPGPLSWADVVHHAARQHNPAADLTLTGV